MPAKKKAVAKKAKPKSKPKTRLAPKLKPKAKVVKSSKPSKAAKRPAPKASPPKLQPDVTAPPPPPRARPRQRVSIGEALAQLNAATLEGVTAEITPFGLALEVELTPNASLAAMLGPEPRPLSVLVGALEDWGVKRAQAEFHRRASDAATPEDTGPLDPPANTPSLLLETEATLLLTEEPRVRVNLEGFVKRNCSL
ncbi:MAG: hypothetical protein QM817_31060 [Archangium sp.]